MTTTLNTKQVRPKKKAKSSKRERKLTRSEVDRIYERVEELKVQQMQNCRIDCNDLINKYKHGPAINIRIASKMPTSRIFDMLEISELEGYYSQLQKMAPGNNRICGRYRKLIKALEINADN